MWRIAGRLVWPEGRGKGERCGRGGGENRGQITQAWWALWIFFKETLLRFNLFAIKFTHFQCLFGGFWQMSTPMELPPPSRYRTFPSPSFPFAINPRPPAPSGQPLISFLSPSSHTMRTCVWLLLLSVYMHTVYIRILLLFIAEQFSLVYTQRIHPSTCWWQLEFSSLGL